MSTLAVDAIVDSSNGNTATINGATPTAYNTMGKNRIINGAMEIDQRNAGASVTGAVGVVYSVDRFHIVSTVASKLTAQQSSTAPTGFSNSLLITSSSAYAVSSSDYFAIQQRIEGFNFSDLSWGTANAKTVTLSFWVRSSLTGTFGGAFINSANDYGYPFTYTISSANTWEQINITVIGPTSGTWVGATNGIGVAVRFGLGVGSTASFTAGSWTNNTVWSATGATSVVGTSGATFYITGVQLEVGSVATEFERRPFGMELALCQRYFEKSYALGTAVGSATFDGLASSSGISLTTSYLGNINTNFAVTKRAAPTVTLYDSDGNSGKCARSVLGGSYSTNQSVASSWIGEGTFSAYSSGSTNSALIACHWTASSEL